MTDIVVTCPKPLWQAWIAEGCLPGEVCLPGTDYHWFGRGTAPPISPGNRVYVVAHGRLRGYAPLVRLEMAPRCCGSLMPAWWWEGAEWAMVRQGGAVAVTIPQPIRGFRGWRYVSWNTWDEIPFPDWRTP